MSNTIPSKPEIPKTIDDFNLIDNSLFTAVLSNKQYGPDFCRVFLKTILGKEPGSFQISVQSYSPGTTPFRKAIQMDVMITEKTSITLPGNYQSPKKFHHQHVYDIEAEKKSKQTALDPLPYRMRFYHSKLDTMILPRGAHYSSLSDVTVIVIANFDPFDRNRFLYTIKNSCVEDPDLVYNDGATTLFLNTRGKVGTVSRELQELLSYIEKTDAEHAVNKDLKRLHSELSVLKQDENFSGGVMHSFDFEMLLREEGRMEERENTLREARRANAEQKRADDAEKRIAELELRLANAQAR